MRLNPVTVLYSVRVTAEEADLLHRVIAYVQHQDAEHTAFTNDEHNTFDVLGRDFYHALDAGE